MSNRGMFKSILFDSYSELFKKEWLVELDKYYRFWYDLIANPQDLFGDLILKELIGHYLKSLKINIENSLEKRFIYFICSRKKLDLMLKKRVVTTF